MYKKMHYYKSHSPVTFEFPYANKHIPLFSRMEIQNDFSECSGCGDCEKVCPVSAIRLQGDTYSPQITKPKTAKGVEKVLDVQSFHIDYSKCFFCGICVRDCPTGSLYNEKKFITPEKEVRLLVKDLKKDNKPKIRGFLN